MAFLLRYLMPNELAIGQVAHSRPGTARRHGAPGQVVRDPVTPQLHHPLVQLTEAFAQLPVLLQAQPLDGRARLQHFAGESIK